MTTRSIMPRFTVVAIAIGLFVSYAVFAQDKSHATSVADDTNPFAEVDTGEANAVTIQVLHDGRPSAKILIRQGEMLSVSRLESKELALGLVPEEISERGSEVRFAAYSVRNHLRADQERTWLRDLTLAVGQPPLVVAEAGVPPSTFDVEVRLVGVTLVTR